MDKLAQFRPKGAPQTTLPAAAPSSGGRALARGVESEPDAPGDKRDQLVLE